MPDPAHPLPEIPQWEQEVMNEQYERCIRKGWVSIPEADFDGKSWTLDFAAKMLGIPERDLRDLVRITGLAPTGVMNMRGYRSQGRTPRAYPAQALIAIAEAIEDLRDFPDSADSA
jgi:hypothetical protein